MKKLLCLVFISIFIFSCKSKATKPNPTLAERAGTYEGGNYTLIIKSSGETQVVDTEKLSHKKELDKASRSTSFDVGSFKIDFSKGVKINGTAELTKKSDDQTFLLTLGERSGVYKGSSPIIVAISSTVEIKPTGEILADRGISIDNSIIPRVAEPSFDSNSTKTNFSISVKSGRAFDYYDIEFTSLTTLKFTNSGGLNTSGEDSGSRLDLGTLTKQ